MAKILILFVIYLDLSSVFGQVLQLGPTTGLNMSVMSSATSKDQTMALIFPTPEPAVMYYLYSPKFNFTTVTIPPTLNALFTPFTTSSSPTESQIQEFPMQNGKENTVRMRMPPIPVPYSIISYPQGPPKSNQMTMFPVTQTCVGFDNILNDLGLVSLGLGIIAVVIGFAGNLFAVEKYIDPFVIKLFSELDVNLPLSEYAILFSVYESFLSIASILLGVITLFPAKLEHVLISLLGDEFVSNYGCNNPLRIILKLFG